MKLFLKDRDAVISVEQGALEAVVLAAQDLQSNLQEISGKREGFPIVHEADAGLIRIRTEENGMVESYTVSVKKDGVEIVGSDVLGTIYGIYAFATECLGILPVYRLVDLFPDVREEMELTETVLKSPELKVRFRGWFLNDEDLLCDYKLGGGHRNIDYPYYQNVMDESVLDMILETALRLGINFMIPASFADINNPDEEKLIAAVCRRGMYITQHHVEPMGVSFFAADSYMKAHGHEDETVSFLQNRVRMEEIWRYYATKWAKYGSQVIWQLGLRGRGDQAVWKSDPNVPDSMEARGGIITDAINTQYNIIKDVLGTDHFFSTTTLFNEGSGLYAEGHLKLPETTIAIFSDLGVDQMFGDDFYTVQHEPTRKYGIYYHAAYQVVGPHLSEGCDPVKMAYCYRDAAENDNLYYSILNISNVRPLHVSAIINARIMRSPLDFDARSELLKLDRELFGDMGEQVNELRREYYDAFADFGEDAIKRATDNWNFAYREYKDLPFVRNPANDGQLSYFGRVLLKGKRYTKLPDATDELFVSLKESAEKFARLYEKAEKIDTLLSGTTQTYFRQYMKHQIRYAQLLNKWCVYSKGLLNKTLSKEERLAEGRLAAQCLEAIIEDRKILETGKWQNWHRGEKKLNFNMLLKLTNTVYERVEDEE